MTIRDVQCLDQDFFLPVNILAVAKSLVGKILVSNIDSEMTAGRIVEVEAYKAPEDKASHAHANKKTKRTEVMFRKGGCSYVYLCYGIHNMLNVVSAPEGIAHAILIRAIEPLEGLSTMKRRRGLENERLLCNGPGKVCQAFGISRQQNACALWDNRSNVWIGNAPDIMHSKIDAGPRVGVAYAQECAYWPWRFKIKGSQWSSPPDLVKYTH